MSEDQAILFDGESEEALFADPEARRKRYTARQVQAIEAKLELILLAFAAGVPVDRIAAAGKVNRRTVEALVAKEAEKVSANAKDFAAGLHQTAAHWMGLARAKEDGAKFSELVIGMGIAAQRGNEIALMGGSAEEKVIELDAKTSDIREQVRKMLEGPKGEGKPQTDADQGKGNEREIGST